MSNVKYEMSNVKYEMSNVKCQIWNVKCHMPNMKCQISNIRRQMLHAKYQMEDYEMSNGRIWDMEAQQSNIIFVMALDFFVGTRVWGAGRGGYVSDDDDDDSWWWSSSWIGDVVGSARLGSNCHFPTQMANPILITNLFFQEEWEGPVSLRTWLGQVNMCHSGIRGEYMKGGGGGGCLCVCAREHRC